MRLGAHEASEDVFSVEFWKGYPPVNSHGRLEITHFFEREVHLHSWLAFSIVTFVFVMDMKETPLLRVTDHPHSLRFSFLSLKKKLQATTGSLKSVVEYGDSEGCLFWPGLLCHVGLNGKSTMNELRRFFSY